MNEARKSKPSPSKTHEMNKEADRKLKCGIIMPISQIGDCNQQHWKEVKGIIEESIVEAGFTPLLVSDANDTGIIQSRIVQNIYDNEMIVCDVSCKNPNVMFELGMRLAFDKPTVIIMDDKTTYSFDTAPIEHLGYPRDLNYCQILDFKEKLTKKVKATYDAYQNESAKTFLKHFGEIKVSSIEHKEGSLNDLILSRLETLATQVDRINASIYTLDSNIHIKPPKEVLENYIHEFCMIEDIEFSELWLLKEDAIQRKKLIAFLENKPIIRHMYKNSDILKRAISDVIEPF